MQTTEYGRKYTVYLYLLLGALSAFPPLVTDMYLPALPAMTGYFGTVPSAVQMSLAACIVGLAAGQIFFGPLSDKYGRRPLLLSALALYILATVASIYAPSIEVFNVCRFLQGLGGAGGVVLSRSVATDCYDGRDLARALAIIGAINGIAPVAAPVIGGLFSESIGWRGIFWILFCVGIILFAYSTPFRESHGTEVRYKGGFGSLMKQPLVLLRNRRFMRYVLVFGLTNGVLFGYISSASFILQNDYGLSELFFGLFFAINSLGIVLGSVVSMKFRELGTALRLGGVLMFGCACLQPVSLAFGGGLAGYEVLAFAMLFGVGLVFPPSTTLAMTEGREMTGWASAIVGATGFMAGGIVTPLVGLGDIQTSTFRVLMVCAGAVSVLSGIFCVARRRVQV